MLGASACGAETASPGDVVESVGAESAVGTLVLALAIEAPPEAAPPTANPWLASGHLRSVSVYVDGESFGDFVLSNEPESAWSFASGPNAEVFSLKLAEAVQQQDGFTTVGAWRTLLSRQIEPGTHVAELREVHVWGPSDIELSANGLIPFEVDGSDTVVFLGSFALAGGKVSAL